MQSLKAIRKEVWGVAGISVSFVLSWILYRKVRNYKDQPNNSQKTRSKNQLRQRRPKQSQEESYKEEKSTTEEIPKKQAMAHESRGRDQKEKRLIRAIKSIEQIYATGDELSLQAIKAIYKSQYTLSVDQYQEVILNSRVYRRSVIANTGKYAKVIRDHIDQLEEVHNRHLDAVLAHFKLSKLHWKEVIERLSDSSQHQEEWQRFLVKSEEEEPLTLRKATSKLLSKKELMQALLLKEKIVEQIKLRKAPIDLDNELVKIDPSTKYEIVDAYAKDTLQAKLELEEEDLLYAYEQLSEEDKEQLNPIYNRITEIMGDIVSEASEEETGLFD